MTSVLRTLTRLALLAAVAAVVWFFRDAAPLRFARDTVAPSNPHRQYVDSLERAGLSETTIGRAWLEASSRAVAEPTGTSLPFTRVAIVNALRPAAFGYAVTLMRGQRLDVVVTLAGDAPAQAFVDVFDPAAAVSASLAGGLGAVAFEPRADDRVIVRIQPELLRGGQLTVSARKGPALRFPVAGANANLQSVFGDNRDAGRRRHEGVDIFAKRGTKVLSASDGLVTRVNETAIGGRVVWVWDARRSLSIYYAHLDEQLVAGGARVRAGDVLGTVGNTGNARTTAPHLHFGIYEAGSGAIDPDAFIRPLPVSRGAS